MSIAIFVPKESGVIVKNAAQMIHDEIKEKFGFEALVSDWPYREVDLSMLAVGEQDDLQDSDIAARLHCLKPEGSQGYHIATTTKGVYLLGANTDVGVLYAAACFLDNITCDETGKLVLPTTEIVDSPDCEIRGASFARYAFRKFSEDAAHLEGMKSLVRYYARNRVNMITVEATGNCWPGDLTPVVTFKYFPPLYDPSRVDTVERRRRMINELISYAHSWGVKVVLYTSEFNHEPDIYQRCPELHGILPETWSEGRHSYIRGCMCLSKDIVWQYLRAKVKETLESLPELDGIELWMVEVPSEFGICACPKCRSKARHEWIEKLINEVRSAIDEVSPTITLYVKTFQSSQGALELERFAPLKDHLPQNTFISCKAQWGDMAYLNDPNPLLGWIQDGKEVAEFDTGGEYCGCGLGAMICCYPEYIAERIRLYYSKGVRKFLARHAVPEWPNKEFTGINDIAFFKLSWDITLDVDQIWKSWAQEQFGAAHEPMTELLKLSDDVVNKSLYVRRACANRHYYIFCDTLDSLKYMMFDLSAFMIEGCLEQLEPTRENIEQILAEKEEAIELCAKMRDAYERAAPLLSEDTAMRLQAILERTERIVATMRWLTHAFFTYLLWERCWSVREKDVLRTHILQLLCKCEEEIDKAGDITEDKWHGRRLWNLRRVVDFERARRFCEEIRGLVNFRIGQRADYTVTVTPATVGHPNTYYDHRRSLRSIFGLPGKE